MLAQRLNRTHWIGLAILCAALIAGVVDAPYPQQMLLQHIPTVAALLAWPVLQNRLRFSEGAASGMALFLLLHILGARYIYSYVPYDDWARLLTGRTLTDVFSFQRNHYDRLVHFAFGLFFTRPAFEIFTRRFGLSATLARYTSIESILAASALYELFEWSLTLLLGGEDVEAYNGQQGDLWDAHKDMALALLGSLCTLPFLRRGTATA